MQRVLILGAGSQAKVVLDILSAFDQYEPVGCLEIGQDASRIGAHILDVPIVDQISQIQRAKEDLSASAAFLAIGDNAERRALYDAAKACDLELPALIHPSAVVSKHANIGEGSVICPQAFVGVDATLGPGCIVNTTASVDHDCKLGAFVNVAVGAHLPGNVVAGDETTFGVGSSAIPGIKVGARVMIAAGACVIRDLPDDVTVKGVPAK